MIKTAGKRTTTSLMLVSGIIFFLFASFLWHTEGLCNFHPITPGIAYRSGQLDQKELEYYIQKYGIRSIINLRGKQSGDRWYSNEIDVCRKYDVRHYDLGLSATQTPSTDDIQELISLLKFADRPLLVHCKAGADRAGLAAALWRMVIEGDPKSEALKELSIRYGHMPFGPTQALDDFIGQYEPHKIEY